MKLFDLLKSYTQSKPRRTAASVAKERLQIIVSHESIENNKPDFVKDLQRELLEVISRYVKIDPDKIRVQLERTGDHSILELNVTLDEEATAV